MTMAEVAAVMDEERPQEPPAEVADLDPDDGALIVFTSGTTGEPRGVLHTPALPGGPARSRPSTGWGPDEASSSGARRATGWSKSARNVFVAPWLCGAAALLHDGRFDPLERLELIEREGVNVLCQAPTEYRMLAKRAELRPIASMRRMVSAGRAAQPGVIDAFRERVGLEICDGYGQTETGQVTGNLVGDEVRDGLDGQAAARARGADRRRRAPGAAGELPDLLQPLPRRRAVRGRVVADGRRGPPRTTTATSGTRAAATT